jgi:hypothetical protein
VEAQFNKQRWLCLANKFAVYSEKKKIEKTEVKLALFTSDMILHIKDPKHSTKKFLDLITLSASSMIQNQNKINSFCICQQ